MALPPYRVDYSPIIDRPKITWPNNARVAFWVALRSIYDEAAYDLSIDYHQPPPPPAISEPDSQWMHALLGQSAAG